MEKTEIATVEAYIAAQPESVREILETVRRTIRKALPRAEEAISYKIPTYKMDGHAVLYFAGWKQHYSLYPASAEMAARFREELLPYTLSKGTIRFPLDQRVPARLIGRLAKFRAAEVAKRAVARGAREKVSRRPSST